MATSREYFALDWIKSELLETLNTARAGLEQFAEALDRGDPADSDHARGALRECVNGLHQVHGTLVMLELKGVTLLADHLERVAEHVMNGRVDDVGSASQSLMQGILELPGHLDELQSGLPDSSAAMLPLVNELRQHLGDAPLAPSEGLHIHGVASEAALRRFDAIDGVGKTRKIRAVYQQVLLTLLKGGDLARAVESLRKVAQGMWKVCDGTPFAAEWQAFAEFVESLALAVPGGGSLDAPAVKLLRRVDSEIREIAQTGKRALERPVSVSLVRQLLDAAADRGRQSETLDELRMATARTGQADSLSLSGRQAMISAAKALREELGTVKDRLDLFVRSGDRDMQGLGPLLAPLKQIASTLSLLGFESSKAIVQDQVDALSSLVEHGRADDSAILNVAGALVQVDENLASLTQSGRGEMEQITDDAERAVTRQTREGLDQVKQCIVDYISSQWDVRHLEPAPAELDAIAGALSMIPLSVAAELIQRCQRYVRQELMAGHVPTWEELDRLADAVSGIDYYLERLASDSPVGADDVLDVVARSLDALESNGGRATARARPSESTPTTAPPYGGATDVDVAALSGVEEEREPELVLEADEDFDLGSELFDDLADAAATPERDGGSRESTPDRAAEASEAAEWELEIEDESDDLVDLLDEVAMSSPGSVAFRSDDQADDVPADVSADGMLEAPSGDKHPHGTTSGGAPAVAAAVLAESLVDNFESDDEIVEIFVEEVDEVLGNVDEHLDAWSGSLEDEGHQGEIRRAFHTLKGSGRMVGANVLGEMAWSVENMLNRVLDGTVAVSGEFVTVVRDARELTPALKDAFERKAAPEMTSVARIIEQADVLASGGTLADTAEPEPAAATEGAKSSAGAAESDEDRLLFLTEAESHALRMSEACRDGGFVLDDEAMRALHTLAGSAAMAGLPAVGELAGPAYELAQVLRGAGSSSTVSGERADFFRQVADAVRTMLADMRAGREPEDQFQLIADADRLLMDVEQTGSSEALLGLPAAAVLVKAAVLLDDWRAGSMDMSLADEVREALAEIEQAAGNQESVAALAGALLGAHERFEFETLSQDVHDVLAQGHEALLAQFDALAAGQTPADADAFCAALDALRPGVDVAPVPSPRAGETEHDDDLLLEEVAAGLSADDPDGGEELLLEPAAEYEAAEEAHEEAMAGGEDAREEPERAAPDPEDVRSEAVSAREPEAAGRSSADDDFSLDLELEELPAPEELEAFHRPPQPGAGEAAAERPPPRLEPELPREPAPRHAPSRPVAPASSGSEPLVPDEVDEDIIAVFFEEADEILEALDHSINDWAGERDNRLHLENLLRGLHTLKGGARLSGLMPLGNCTHEFESFLIEFQDRGAPADAALFGDLHARYDELASLLARTRAAVAGEASPPEPDTAHGADAHGADEPPAAARQAEPPAEPQAPVPDKPGRPAEPVPAILRPASAEPRDEASAPSSHPPAAASAKVANFRPRRSAGQRAGVADERADAATAQARAAEEMVRVGAGLLESLVNLAGESSIIRARVEQGMSDFTGALDEMETTIDRLREQLRRLEIETEAQILFRQERLDGPSYEEFDPLEMDRYSQLQQLSRSLGESASDMLDLKETLLFKAREAETLLLQQARVNTELQEGLMRSRMVPFSRLLPRLRRTVRQVAKELDKNVELHAYNVEGELDRTLLERMVPPLEHMLRNAVDHGIEHPGERRARGKVEAGRIDLRLSREGGDVVIEIADDGAGIDVQRVRAKAVERGLMAADAQLHDEEISQFVLAPGFSTAASVTQISGRGVGMDVVHSEVKQLGGSISIHSERGRGTRFVLRVPFTVSVNRALMVSVGEDLYAIPLNTIEGIVLLGADELERLYAPDGHTFEYAGVPYRVQYLGNFLGREYHAQPMQGSVPVVLVRSGEHAVAVHVDGVQGSREIVVKSLGPQFAGVGGISGATILGDGSVVVILDLLALIRTQSGGLSFGKRTRAGAARTRCVMVVDDSVTVRKVTSRLLERQGMDVVVAKDGVEAVSLLQERRPDVMLLDIEMPRMDGFEVLRQVRHDERLKSLPIVMISSRTGTKHQERAAELGVSRFLGKPFQESELLATIDELVN